MAIQFNGMSVGNQFLDAQKFSSSHKADIESYLSTYFCDPDKKTPFHLVVKEGESVVQMEGRTAVLPKTSELKRVERIFRFYQHAGLLPKIEMGGKDQALAAQATKKSVKAMHDATIPGANGSLLAGIRITDDTLSLTRNILSAIPSVGAHDPVVKHLGYYAGMIWTFFSFRELDQGITNCKRAKRIEDGEGLRRAKASVVSGALCSVGSISYLSGRVCESLSASADAAGAFGAASALFGIGSILGAWASFLGAWRCSGFNDRLEEYTEHKKLTDVERFRGALNFLKEAISVTPEEKSEVSAKIEADHPDWSPEQKENLLKQKLVDATEVKVKYMKRRTSSKSLYLILTKTDAILSKLNDSMREKEGIREAALLLIAVRQENNIKMSLYVLGFIASMIGLAALAIATFFTAGVFPFVLYGISGTIYLATTLYQSAGILIKREGESKEIELYCDRSKKCESVKEAP